MRTPMPLHPVFHPPTRVSRLYPIMTLALMIGSSSLVYAWQSSELNATSAVQDRNIKIDELTAENERLSEQAIVDQATLQAQQAKLDELTSKLASIESDLAAKTAELKTASDQLAAQKSQLASNSAELEKLRDRPPLFSFQNESSLPDVEQKQADVKTVVSNAYDYIVLLYGRPYLLNSITITFVDSFSIPGAAGEIQISNGPKGISIDIRIKDFDKNDFQDVNTIIHEIIHGFHGVAVFDLSALEEGIAVAATDAVMAAMIADGKLKDFGQLYLNISDAQFASYNSSLSVLADTDAFYSYSQIGKVYQLTGTAWYKLYKADAQFFKKFNDAYYAKVQKGQTVDAAGIRSIISGIVSTVGGTPIATFLQDQKAFNPS